MNSSKCILLFALIGTGVFGGRITEANTVLSNGVSLSGKAPAVRLKADNACLAQVLLELKSRFAVTFTGFDDQMEKRVSLSCSGSVPDIIQKLLKTAHIQNCAFTFHRDRLTRVAVFPVVTPVGPDPAPEIPVVSDSTVPLRFKGTAVEISSVMKETQAEHAGLEPDDIIITYKGRRIIHARALIAQVKKDSIGTSADIVVFREGALYRYHLKPGFIGVRVFTVPMDVRLLKSYYKALESGEIKIGQNINS